jgi:hypothetical protein
MTARHDYAAAIVVDGFSVEIHRYLCARPLFDVDHDALFARARREPDGFLIPEDSDLFLTLGIHAAKHGLELEPKSFTDGVRLVDAGGVVAPTVVARARAWRATRAIAAWIHALVAHGLDDADSWRRAAAQLDPHGAARVLPHNHTRRILALLDDGRALPWLAQRTGLRLLDLVTRG